MKRPKASDWLFLGLLLCALTLASCGGEGTPGPEELTPRERVLLQQLDLMHGMYVDPPLPTLVSGCPFPRPTGSSALGRWEPAAQTRGS